MGNAFTIPVVLFLFKRKESSIKIVEQIAKIKPCKLYLLADYGRTPQENSLADECRIAVESAVTWPCEVIKDYATENRGVYQNIGEGARRVLQKEECAIFLEDDNLPEVTFFRYCAEMLEKYRSDPRVLWVCGTNYCGQYNPQDGESYKFTQHMLPCGWASWSEKFLKYYDGSMSSLKTIEDIKSLRKKFETGRLYRMYRDCWLEEKARLKEGKQPQSWDYQMCLALRKNNLLGIVPMNNQIKNIGVDDFSIHGGTSMGNIMTQRYCGMNSYPLLFPLVGPKQVDKDPVFEKKLEKIIVMPLKLRARIFIVKLAKKILGRKKHDSLREYFQKRR